MGMSLGGTFGGCIPHKTLARHVRAWLKKNLILFILLILSRLLSLSSPRLSAFA